MKTSEKIDQIAPALLAAQKEIGNATKNAKNPHFKNNYADLGAVIEAVKEPLNRNGIVLIQTLSHDSGTSGGLLLRSRLLHSSGQWIEDCAFSPLPKADPQGVGSATTYLRRYSLAAMLCITQEDDDGESASRRSPATKEQVDKLKSLDGVRVAKALAFYKVNDLSELDSTQAATVISKING